jgi:hypothetical protein
VNVSGWSILVRHLHSNGELRVVYDQRATSGNQFAVAFYPHYRHYFTMKNVRPFFAFFLLIFALSAQAESPAPPEITNALIYVDHFMGSGKTALVADVISIKHDALKFRLNGNDFDYSGHFSILLATPRKHKNPYFGLGSPDTAKLLTLEDFFKGDSDGTMLLQNATIWEKSDGFIVAVAMEKEWIHSGNYTIQK